MSGKTGITLLGAPELIRALKLADPRVRARLKPVISKNTKAVVAKAKALTPHVSGELAGTIRDEYTEDGLAGFAKVGKGKLPRRSKAVTAKGQKRAKGRKRKTGEGAYGVVVERGDKRRNRKARRFLGHAFASQRPTAANDIAHAVNDTVKDI